MTDHDRPEPTGAQGAQLLKGLAELALLSVLKARPHYGLEILDRLRGEAGLGLAEGTIYPLLHRLERAGLTRAEWRIEEAGARPRKYYALTDKGRAELDTQSAEWRRIAGALTAFLDRSGQ
jgi:PadR family transcriptional regulator